MALPKNNGFEITEHGRYKTVTGYAVTAMAGLAIGALVNKANPSLKEGDLKKADLDEAFCLLNPVVSRATFDAGFKERLFYDDVIKPVVANEKMPVTAHQPERCEVEDVDSLIDLATTNYKFAGTEDPGTPVTAKGGKYAIAQSGDLSTFVLEKVGAAKAGGNFRLHLRRMVQIVP